MFWDSYVSSVSSVLLEIILLKGSRMGAVFLEQIFVFFLNIEKMISYKELTGCNCALLLRHCRNHP